MNTKYIARITGLPVAHINSAARDLDIATYDAACRCWRVETGTQPRSSRTWSRCPSDPPGRIGAHPAPLSPRA